MSNQKVRVRFAPSPTGPLHMGGVRTALFNYLFAKRNGGDFLLRIEDTDQTRYVPGAEDYIMKSLEWCGIVVDEGIREGGDCGPYRQSERKALYRKYADELIASGNAYYAFDTAEELDAKRAAFEAKKETFTYNSQTRGEMNNSISLSAEEVEGKIAAGEQYVVRFKMPDNHEVKEEDMIRGWVSFNTDQLDDKVLFKSDGMPTYHLANVVDDHLMGISHVIRGEEWLPSMPLHVLLYQSLGWGETMPRFAHLPLILKPVGKGKLSKRDGDKMGFPVFPLEWTDPKSGELSSGYREDGYFAEAFVNMLAFLGWNPGTEQELFSMDELIESFSLDRVGKSGSKFDPDKTKWYNHQYLMTKDDAELAVLLLDILKEKGIESTPEKAAIVCGMLKERVDFVSEIYEQGAFFFQAPESYDAKAVKKRWKEGVPEIMSEILEFLKGVDNWEAAPLKEVFSPFVTEKGWGFGVVMNAFRLSLVGAAAGPDLFDICAFLGKEEVLLRIENAINNIKR
ncbi:glutamate--tRNA ligase [Puteibacter caeruleilacunae]|nr:glutamate--tRNA ligase [Puteibacter caeruleilacunae]